MSSSDSSSRKLGMALLLATSVFAAWWVNRKDRSSHKEMLKDAKEFFDNSECKIYKFVITGGPCSGKTTAMEKLQVRHSRLATFTHLHICVLTCCDLTGILERAWLSSICGSGGCDDVIAERSLI
jgi:hypothetical protein